MDRAALVMQKALARANPPIRTAPDELPQRQRASVPNGSG
jgi:hypothetical protein